MKEIEELENGKLVFHSYGALKTYCDDVNNPLDKVVLGEEITALNSEDVSGIIRGLFEGSKRTNKQFKGIADWDVSNVKNMEGMFRCADGFNQPLNNWDVSKVENMSCMFYEARNFNQPLNNWDVSKVENMSYMFDCAESFNQPIGNWDVSKVSNMHCMFDCAKNFNQPLDNWDVSKVENMCYMFYLASNFNQPLDNFSSGQKKSAEYHFDEVKYKKEQARNNNSSSNSSEGYIDKVIKLAELREKGLLSEAEFEKMKEDLLK